MATRVPSTVATYEDYLALEEKSDEKHEYVGGQVFAMAGGTIEHAALAAAMSIGLGKALEGKPCRVFTSDARVRVEETNFSCYPDLSVVCTKVETSAVDKHAIINPRVIVEVLSESTEDYDRGAKFAHYRRIPALAEYVIVHQREPLIEVWRKNELGQWTLITEARAAQQAELSSIGVSLSVDEIYADPLA